MDGISVSSDASTTLAPSSQAQYDFGQWIQDLLTSVRYTAGQQNFPRNLENRLLQYLPLFSAREADYGAVMSILADNGWDDNASPGKFTIQPNPAVLSEELQRLLNHYLDGSQSDSRASHPDPVQITNAQEEPVPLSAPQGPFTRPEHEALIEEEPEPLPAQEPFTPEQEALMTRASEQERRLSIRSSFSFGWSVCWLVGPLLCFGWLKRPSLLVGAPSLLVGALLCFGWLERLLEKTTVGVLLLGLIRQSEREGFSIQELAMREAAKQNGVCVYKGFEEQASRFMYIFEDKHHLRKPIKTVLSNGKIETEKKRSWPWFWAQNLRGLGIWTTRYLESMSEEAAEQHFKEESPFVFHRSTNDIALVRCWSVTLDAGFARKFEQIPVLELRERKSDDEKKIEEFQVTLKNLTGEDAPKENIFFCKFRELMKSNSNPVFTGNAQALLNFLKSNPRLMNRYFEIAGITEDSICVRMGPRWYSQKWFRFHLGEEYALYKRTGHSTFTCIQSLSDFKREKMLIGF